VRLSWKKTDFEVLSMFTQMIMQDRFVPIDDGFAILRGYAIFHKKCGTCTRNGLRRLDLWFR